MIRGLLVQVPERSQLFIRLRNETPWIVAARVSNEDYRISVAPGRRPRLSQRAAQNRKPFACSGSGSSRIRFTADLASHSRAFCRNSAAV
jgi:hypothetical protein